jgi:cytochrome c biogenesis protein CcmG/thiol:disulfide interchange protein DsbE
MQERQAFWIVLPVAVALGLLVLLLATGDPASERNNTFQLQGEVAPLIEGPTIDGGWFDIDDERGRWVIVNFFSTSCVPCIVEHPELVAFSDAHDALGDATVVSLAFDDRAENVVKFFQDNGGSWPVLAQDTGEIAVQYGVTGVPESYIVAPSGVVVGRFIGGLTAAALDDAIATLTGADT